MSGLYLLIPTFIILLLLCPITLEGRLSFNLPSRSGAIGLFLFGFKVLYFIYEIDGKTLILRNQKQTKVKHISMDDQEFLLVENFIKQIKDKTRLKQLFVFYNLGLGDAFLSALVGGLINSAALTFFTSIKSSKPTASLGIYDTISYNKEIFEVALKTKITISLVDVAYSFANSVILTWKAKSKVKHNI